MADPPEGLSLPPEVFERAMASHHRLQEARIRKLNNLHRAVFAEFVVASILGDHAAIALDPAAAWDITWNPPNRTEHVRLQVKCSGERKPRYPDRAKSAEWKLTEPKHGYDPLTELALAKGHHCDVIVFARHLGWDIAAGWEFRVIRPSQLPTGPVVRDSYLKALGAFPVQPAALGGAILDALEE